MENKNFFQRSWQSIAMILGLVTLWWLAEVSIWYSVIFLLFFWLRSQMEGKPSNYRALSIAMLIIFFIALGNAGINKILPRTASKKTQTMAFIDQFFSKGAPSNTKVRAQDIFDQSYQDASEKALVEFEELVREGKVEEAAKLLEDFEKKWTFKPFKKQKEEEVSDSNQNSTIIEPEIKNLILHQGSHIVEVRGVSHNIVIKTRPGRNMYSIEPVDGIYNHQILMDGESVPIQDGPNVKLPSSMEPKFRIIYHGSNQPKRLKITVR